MMCQNCITGFGAVELINVLMIQDDPKQQIATREDIPKCSPPSSNTNLMAELTPKLSAISKTSKVDLEGLSMNTFSTPPTKTRSV